MGYERLIMILPDSSARIEAIMRDQLCSLGNAVAIFNNQIREEESKKEEKLSIDIKGMSKTEIIKATWDLPELPKDLYDLLKEQGGFMTGSNVVADIDNPKDEDWCVQMPPSVFAGYTLGQSNHGYWEADGFGTVYCHHNGKLINIICFSDRRLCEAWYVATKVMEELKDKNIPRLNNWYDRSTTNTTLGDLVATKWKRVILFRALKDIAYEPSRKRPMDRADAIKYKKCVECSREAIYFTCKAARDNYETTTVCERCAGIEY